MRSEDVQSLRIHGRAARSVARSRRRAASTRSTAGSSRRCRRTGASRFAASPARVGVSEATVRARYGRLTAEGILQVVAVTNPLGLGYEQALVGVKTSGSPERGGRRDRALARGRLRRRHGRAVRPRRRARRCRPAPSARADEPAARAAGRRLDRDLRVPRDVETALRLGEWNAKGGTDEMSITQSATSADDLGVWRTTISGSTSRAWAGTRRRSSCAATAATSRTSRGTATSTRSRGSSPSTSATASARRSARPRSSRCASCPSTRTGRTRTRARSSSRPRSRRSRPATSTASSSSRAAPRPSSRRGSSRASTSRLAAARRGTHGVEPGRRIRRQTGSLAGPRPQVQGDRPQDRVPRHDVRRALDQRHRRAAHAVRAARARGTARQQHEPLPPARRRDGGAVHRRSCSTSSSGRSSRWIPRRSASSTWSRSRTPAARSSRPAGYWRVCASSATSYDILLSADEVITGFGRVGHWFASERYDIRPDIVTCAKGLSSSYAAIGAVVATDRVMEPFLADTLDVLARDHVRRPSRDERDRAQEHRDHEAGADHGARPRATRTRSARRSRSCSTCRSSATCAGRASSTRSSS